MVFQKPFFPLTLALLSSLLLSLPSASLPPKTPPSSHSRSLLSSLSLSLLSLLSLLFSHSRFLYSLSAHSRSLSLSIDRQRPCTSNGSCGPAGSTRKKSDGGGDILEHGLDPELRFEITFPRIAEKEAFEEAEKVRQAQEEEESRQAREEGERRRRDRDRDRRHPRRDHYWEKYRRAHYVPTFLGLTLCWHVWKVFVFCLYSFIYFRVVD